MGWKFIPEKKYFRQTPFNPVVSSWAGSSSLEKNILDRHLSIRLNRHRLEVHPWEKIFQTVTLRSGCIVMGWKFIPGKKYFRQTPPNVITGKYPQHSSSVRTPKKYRKRFYVCHSKRLISTDIQQFFASSYPNQSCLPLPPPPSTTTATTPLPL